MRVSSTVLAFAITLCGCEGPGALPSGGIVVPPDLGSSAFCADTAVDGTCAQKFFARVVRCFEPDGACVARQDDTSGDVCWAGGARLSVTFELDAAHGAWWSGMTKCMEADVRHGNDDQSLFRLTSGRDTLSYDEKTGDVTCPDGSRTNIGANDANCSALRKILNPAVDACADGACP